MADIDTADQAFASEAPSKGFTALIRMLAPKLAARGVTGEDVENTVKALDNFSELIRALDGRSDLTALLGGNREAADAVRAFFDKYSEEDRRLLTQVFGNGASLKDVS